MAAGKNDDVHIEPKLLLQLDLNGHSAWMRNAEFVGTAVQARIEFAERVTAKLKSPYKFARVFWGGDGGLFARGLGRSTSNYDIAVDAAKAVVTIFEDWRSEVEDRRALQLRVSLHFAPEIYVHEDTGYWTSDDLNLFMKFEHDIAAANAIAATGTFRRNLSESYGRRFKSATKRELHLTGTNSPGYKVINEVYYEFAGEAKHDSSLSLAMLYNGLDTGDG